MIEIEIDGQTVSRHVMFRDSERAYLRDHPPTRIEVVELAAIAHLLQLPPSEEPAPETPTETSSDRTQRRRRERAKARAKAARARTQAAG